MCPMASEGCRALLAALFVAALIVTICIAGSETFAQKHPLMNAVLKGSVFYSFLGGIYFTVQFLVPSFASLGFLLGLFIGSVGGAVFYHSALIENKKQKPQNPSLALSENNIKTLAS